MKKLALQLESLHVESFATSATTDAQAGTVRAHAAAYTYYYEPSCGGPSCAVVCRSRYETPCV